tara:strand:- start:473 stop:733 length:261 start_codon:yes stop_codon:yes gene_type:complete
MGCCISKDDIQEEEERIYFKNENYTEEDIRELGQCDICKKNNVLVSFYLNEGCLCWACEAIIMGRGDENVYDIKIDRFNRKYQVKE